MKRFLISFFLLTSASAAAHEGWGIVSTPAGQMYFTDIPRNIVWRIGRDGRVAIALDATIATRSSRSTAPFTGRT